MGKAIGYIWKKEDFTHGFAWKDSVPSYVWFE
jgi:hypothetical protein